MRYNGKRSHLLKISFFYAEANAITFSEPRLHHAPTPCLPLPPTLRVMKIEFARDNYSYFSHGEK